MRWSSADLAEIKARVSLPSLVARSATLIRAGRLLVARCPLHRERTPSLTLYEDGHFHCFGCGAHGDAIDWVMQISSCGFVDAVEYLQQQSGVVVPLTQPAHSVRHPDDDQNHRRALEIWRSSTPLAGTLGEAYLRQRGIIGDLPPTLRYHPSLYHKRTGRRWPAIVAAVQEPPPGRRVCAVHRTFLDGAKAVKPRMRLGSCPGGAIRLGPVELERWLVIGEGLESVMTLTSREGLPGWVGMGAGNLPRLVLPTEARRIVLVVDHDANGLGEDKAREAAERWIEEGRHVRLLIPSAVGDDVNDVVRRHDVA